MVVKSFDGIDIYQSFIPKGKRNRPGYYNPIDYITVHNTGNYAETADADNHIGFLNNTQSLVSWHYTVDDEKIVQHIPDRESAYHATDGAGPGNRKSIGVEICVNGNDDDRLRKATDRAAKLIANLCRTYDLDASAIKQHHYFYNKKNCPEELRSGRPYTWDTFIHKVEEYMKEPITNVDDAVEYLKDQGIIDSPDYWKNSLNYVKNLDSLLVKFAEKYRVK